MKRILVVDDEPQVLKAINRVFAHTDYEYFTCLSAKEALELLENEKIDLIISDMRMPVIDGYELLSLVRKKYPNIIRVILSGYADEKIIVKSLCNNLAKVYLFKPWKNDVFLKTIENVFETLEVLNSRCLLQIINNIELPTLKHSHQKIISMINNDDEIDNIAAEIEKDPSISAKLLHVANAIVYMAKTNSIKQATIIVGLINLKNIIYTTSVVDSSRNRIESNALESIWEHAVWTNKILAFMYDKFFHKKITEIAFSAGLLHNIGEIILVKEDFKRYYSRYINAKENRVNLLELEKSDMEITHQEVGVYLIHWWDLPFDIIETTLYHHKPHASNIINKELVASVHIAEFYAWRIMRERRGYDNYPTVFEIVDINQMEFEEKLKIEFDLNMEI